MTYDFIRKTGKGHSNPPSLHRFLEDNICRRALDRSWLCEPNWLRRGWWPGAQSRALGSWEEQKGMEWSMGGGGRRMQKASRAECQYDKYSPPLVSCSAVSTYRSNQGNHFCVLGVLFLYLLLLVCPSKEGLSRR